MGTCSWGHAEGAGKREGGMVRRGSKWQQRADGPGSSAHLVWAPGLGGGMGLHQTSTVGRRVCAAGCGAVTLLWAGHIQSYHSHPASLTKGRKTRGHGEFMHISTFLAAVNSTNPSLNLYCGAGSTGELAATSTAQPPTTLLTSAKGHTD